MAAPHLKVDPAVKTQVLAELRTDGSLHIPATLAVVPGGQSPEATTAAHMAAAVPAVPRVLPHTLLNVAHPAVPAARVHPMKPTEVLAAGANVEHLVGHVTLMSPEVAKQIAKLRPPKANQAQVLRFVSFQGDQIVGGYTVIVQGK